MGVEDERLLTLDGFLQWVTDKARHDVKHVWRALQACGYDVHFDRYANIVRLSMYTRRSATRHKIIERLEKASCQLSLAWLLQMLRFTDG